MQHLTEPLRHMANRPKVLRWAIMVVLTVFNALAYAQVTLPKIFSDNMVLQRNIDIPVWGTANAGTQISVEFNGHRLSTVATPDGKWSLRLPQMPAGGPYLLSVYTHDSSQPVITYKNILVGDVWLASGQSNMEWQVQQSQNADIEAKNANYPNLRFFKVPHHKTNTLQTDVLGGSWSVCDSLSVKEASAVAYFFARQLHTELNVPIGIVQATWGGTPVEAWTSREQLLSSPITKTKVLAHDTITPQHFVKDSLDLIRFWEIVYTPNEKTVQTVANKPFNDAKWPELTMPKTFKDWGMPFYEGMVWLRKTVAVPTAMLGNELIINLGHPEMNYSLYVNGTEICKTVWNANLTHSYTIPAKLVDNSELVIAVRMAVLWGGGGFNPPADEMYLTDGATKISLAGNWKYMKDLEPAIPKINNYHRYPTYLYNAMINPVVPYGLKGFIWYQGEDNVSAATDYQTLFPMMVADWRIRWQQGYLPFLYVQLANYLPAKPDPSESDWAALREAQTLTLAQPNTAMACIIDIGDGNNIHPTNKQEVGRRLALLAENTVYLKSVQAYGPLFKSFNVDNGQVTVQFTEIGTGLAVRGDGALKGFAIAGNDKVFYWADAKIVGNTVVLSCKNVKNPVAVRYAWADNPACNLINNEGLPAVPFRTDK